MNFENDEKTIRHLNRRVAALETENAQQRASISLLEEAAEQVVFECEAYDNAMLPSVSAVNKLRALLPQYRSKRNESI